MTFLSDSSDETSTADETPRRELYNRLAQAEAAQIIELESSDEDAHSDTVTILALSRPSSLRGLTTAPPSPDQRERQELIDRMYGLGIDQNTLPSPPGSPFKSSRVATAATNGHRSAAAVEDVAADSVFSPTYVFGQDEAVDSNAESMSADDEADPEPDEGPTCDLQKPVKLRQERGRRRQHRKRRRREVTINLEHDSEFFALLHQALTSLTEYMGTEKKAFNLAVRELARIVANVATPSKSKDNVYAWRETFSLWVEAEIFEGATERTRGERPIEEVQKRLDWFVEQIGRRKLAKKMNGKDSRAALERFVELNQQLIELKRIGYANREAARKILKKHDKRLGLSASHDFPEFVQRQRLQQDSTSQNGALIPPRTAVAHKISSDEMTSLVFSGITTLPHILLSTITEILLPIIPQIDDYACLICGDLAWRPITLDCKHMFCIRCLVKMQRRGQNACPSCRAPVVMQAGKENLNVALVAFEKLWFPREVKEKEKANSREVAKEVAEDLQIEDSRCIIA